MIQVVQTNKKPQTMVIRVETSKPEEICVMAKDKNKPNTFYSKRKGVVSGVRDFEIPFPKSPSETIIAVYNKKNGILQGEDPTFKISDFKQKDLATCPIWMSPETISFIKFAQEFAENASVLSAGDTVPHIYRSDDGKFNFDYYIRIRDRKTGNYVNTPARIGHLTGIIEISKKDFLKYSVPMRMIILLHEYSHKYLNPKINREISYETGADINALLLYFSLGYSYMEAHQAFLYVFRGANNDENLKRYLIIKDFINKYSKGQINNCYAKTESIAKK
jgi:hypothetical protein